MHRSRRGGHGFFSHAVHHTKAFLGGADHFFRHWGPAMRQAAMIAAPTIAPSHPALAAGIASVGQAANSYAELRQQLG